MLSPIFIFFLSFSVAVAHRVIPVKDPNNIVMTFGSCYSHRLRRDTPTELFYHIRDLNPDVYVWLGDVAYVDKMIIPPIFLPNEPENIKKLLDMSKNFPEYKAMREKVPVIGTWDDHDFGLNNGDKSFDGKVVTQQLWLDFIDEPQDSPRRKQKGIYDAYYLGDPSLVKVILLDVRYFRDPPKVGKDILGEEQWAWLENELRNNTAHYVVIGSGTQYFPDDRITPEVWYPESKERLLALIRKHKLSRVLLISGDVHFSEIVTYPCKERVGYDLVEFTSSGLSHKLLPFNPWIEWVVMEIYPDTYNTKKDRWPNRNFGIIRFSFGKEKGVTLETISPENKVVLSKKIKDEDLNFDEKIIDLNKKCVVDEPFYGRILAKIGKEVRNLNPYIVIVPIVVLLYLGVFIGIIAIILKLVLWILKRILRLFVGKKIKTD
jgi:alkaline phosphatase D